MGFLDDLIARSTELLHSPLFAEPVPVEEFSVRHDLFDADDWSQLISEVPALASNQDELANDYDYVNPFMEDMFNLLHQGDPKVHDLALMHERFRPNRDMVASFHGLAETDSLRLSTMHDKYATAMALISMHDKLKDAFKRTAEARQAAEQAAAARDAAQAAAQALLDALADAEDAIGTADEGDAVQALAAAVQAAEATR